MSRNVVVIGGGVIGLSIAYWCARHSHRVTVIDRGPLGRQSSWAAVGLLPYFNLDTARDPLDRLAARACRLNAEWYQALQQFSGIDSEYEVTGSIYLARTKPEIAGLRGLSRQWTDEAIPHQQLVKLAGETWLKPWNAFAVPQDVPLALGAENDAQVRPPRVLKGLIESLSRLNVEVLDSIESFEWRPAGPRVEAIQLADGRRVAGDVFCLAAGAWSADLLQELGVSMPLVPIRGQALAFRLAERPFRCSVYEGAHYLVIRRDGLLVAGSTLEDVGWDNSVTRQAIDQLGTFVRSIVPGLEGRQPDYVWSGLRPAAFDGFPYIGQVPGWDNLLVAAGHFRAGIQLAPITAHGILQLIAGDPPDEDLMHFRVGRR